MLNLPQTCCTYVPVVVRSTIAGPARCSLSESLLTTKLQLAPRHAVQEVQEQLAALVRGTSNGLYACNRQ